ncbi:hypothetical protein Trco_003575 [Trichoderma cornu-damae]|uniref:Uncharacterized protein n=1 Tax=Trichoderma cornu-damae TaxID=654480 RepID=A0A9P8QRF9_9HYPO|nr:hypothetical protein Trco_003575 [Trichoderma cornu-damae]
MAPGFSPSFSRCLSQRFLEPKRSRQRDVAQPQAPKALDSRGRPANVTQTRPERVDDWPAAPAPDPILRRPTA